MFYVNLIVIVPSQRKTGDKYCKKKLNKLQTEHEKTERKAEKLVLNLPECVERVSCDQPRDGGFFYIYIRIKW